MKKGSSVVIALLAVLAIVFGILFITKNNETSDLNNRIKSLEENLGEKAETIKNMKTTEEVEAAIEAAKAEAVEGLKTAEEVEAAIAEATAGLKTAEEVEAAIAEATAGLKNEEEVQAAITEATAGLKTAEEVEAAINEAVEAAKKEATEGLKNAEEVQAAIEEATKGLKTEEEVQTAINEAVEAAKKEATEGLKTAEEVEAAIADAVKAAKDEAQKAIDEAEGKAEELKNRVTELEAQIAAAAAGDEKGNEEETEKKEETPAENTVEAAPDADADAKNIEETPAEDGKDAAEGAAPEIKVMTYAEYAAAEMDSEVTVEMYVQAHQAWWEDKVTVYAQDKDGGYFVYNMACSEEDAAKLIPGTKIRVKGTKTQWPEAVGEIEIIDATFEFVEGADTFIADPTDVTDKLGTDELAGFMNVFASFKGMTVAASKDADGNDVPFLYKWNGSGADGDDLYFNVSVNDAVYTFVVESYLCPAGSEVYEAVKALQIGDKIDLEGFLYWYESVQPHITLVTKAE